jgi:amino acid transporter
MDGGFFPYFGAFSAKVGTPLRASLLFGVIATVFSFAAILLLRSGAASTFGVVLSIAISTTLISYILIFPSAYLLRRHQREVPRPCRLGRSGNGLMIVWASLITFWVLLGSWTSVVLGTLNRPARPQLLVPGERGVSQATFTAFTLGTLAVIVAVSVAGYLQGKTCGPTTSCSNVQPEAVCDRRPRGGHGPAPSSSGRAHAAPAEVAPTPPHEFSLG